MRAALLLLLVLPVVLPAQPLQQKLRPILNANPRVHWGILAVQAKSGRVLARVNDQQFFIPASNTKLFSTALALQALGPDYRFSTKVLAAAEPSPDGTIAGDLVLYGGGDPSLSARRYPYQREEPFGPDRLEPLRGLARQLKERGVKKVMGKLIGDDTWHEHDPIPTGWGADDGLFEYGAPVSALSFNDNTVHLKADAATVVFDPAVPHFTVRNRAIAGERRRVRVQRPPGSNQIQISGALGSDGAPYANDFAVEDPALFAAQAFRVALEAEGIAVAGETEARHEAPTALEAVELARRDSPPLVEILQVVDKESQNLHAELVRREAEKRLKLADFLTQAKINAEEETYLLDGSGLSRQNLVSPRAVVALLRHMWLSPARDQFRAMLPIGAEDGTLRRRFEKNPRAKRIQAKTGTLSHVAALGGYAESRRYGTIAFQIVANNYNEPSAKVRKAIDDLALLLAQ